MITVKDFYNQWEGVEAKLIDMLEFPMLSTTSSAERRLNELYEMKKTLDKLNPTPTTQINGIYTKLFGKVNFEQTQKWVNNCYDVTSEKYMILKRGAVMCQSREEDLEFFIERGYLPNKKNR